VQGVPYRQVPEGASEVGSKDNRFNDRIICRNDLIVRVNKQLDTLCLCRVGFAELRADDFRGRI
jgi:hypothetical protein